MGYSSFKGLIACFPEVYLRFKGLMPIDGGQKRRNDVGMRLLLCFVRRMTSPLKRK